MRPRVAAAILSLAFLSTNLASAAEPAEVGPSGRDAVSGKADGSPSGSAEDGAPIPHDLAKSLFDRIATLRESDGCRLAHFDTERFQISIGLQAPSGTEHVLTLTPSDARAAPKVGDWALVVPGEAARDCGVTSKAIEGVLSGTAFPRRVAHTRSPPLAPPEHPLVGAAPRSGGSIDDLPPDFALLVAEFALLCLGTLAILVREVRAQRPSPWAVLALVFVWAIALVLRLTMSPRTFLHEYYHIAETLHDYLGGGSSPMYGNTGPALFRFAAVLFDRPQDVQLIFVTNAVISSLAIPAVALLDLALMRSWPRALCAAVLLCVLPQHLRFSAAEDLFVQAVTFGLWASALFALYMRTRSLADALLAAVALSLAIQTRPEMVLFPAVLVALLLLSDPKSWRLLFAGRTLLALALAALLLVPRFLDLQRALQSTPSPTPRVPDMSRYVAGLNLLRAEVTPRLYWLFLAVGLIWGVRRRPGLMLWAGLVFLGWTLFTVSLFDNQQYHLRAQLLPIGAIILVAAGAASVWTDLWRGSAGRGIAPGALVLAVFAAAVLATSNAFVTELRDQQLEWNFLERTVPNLPERGTLLTATNAGGRNLDRFPDFLLSRAGKRLDEVDLREAAKADGAWPNPGDDLIYYQGMFCYFAFDDEPSPEPMTAACRAVHEHYVLEPLVVEELHVKGYSWLHYASPPYLIGFYRAVALR